MGAVFAPSVPVPLVPHPRNSLWSLGALFAPRAPIALVSHAELGPDSVGPRAQNMYTIEWMG
jgi:hypothetical protein